MNKIAAILADLPTQPDRVLPSACYTDPEFFAFEQEVVFPRGWICVGREEQIANPGDCLSARPAGENTFVIRNETGGIHAVSAVCQHRGEILECVGPRHLRCPLHFWTYDMSGSLVGAPRTSPGERADLVGKVRLPPVRVELWRGFIFVNLDGQAPPLAPSLAKVEPFWENYQDLVAIPPKLADTPLPWNWKVHVENFTDAYHPEFVHRGTHDFAPSVHADGGVGFTPMADGDNAIVRTVPLMKSDGGMMEDGWGEPAAFPAIPTLAEAQRRRLVFVLIPPSMTLVFAPGAIAYTLISPVGAVATLASSDRVTAGGWLLPRTTTLLPDFEQRKAAVLKGAAKIWAQDVPLNLGMQEGKRSRFAPPGYYMHLETTLVQFNAWLLQAYRAASRAG